MTPVLSVEGLGLRFGGVTALTDVSFSVDAGERMAMIGPNGAGKTSLLNCVSGVERPSTGRISVDGQDVARVPVPGRASLGVARTLQGLAVVPELDVLANLLLGRHRFGRAGVVGTALRLKRARNEEAAAEARCRVIAEELGLGGQLDVRAGSLPLGTRKRVELGRALAMDPRLLLLDEPFAGAGPEDLALMVAAVRRVSDEAGAAVVLVDHDLPTVLGGLLAHRAVVLDAGRVVATGRPEEVAAHPGVIDAYLGARYRTQRPAPSVR
ncbi:MAG: ATP-binding cassette domain-containing protein [Actinomycetota bacterium]|nr:ATP-binding cassette domain-containing protein [Actinomycetota bacterium]